MLELNRIYNEDNLEIMKNLPDGFADLAFIDPPYGIGCDGGTYQFGDSPKHYDKKKWDSEIPPAVFFEELFRVSKNQIIFGGNYFTNYLRPTKSWIVWDKIGNLGCVNNFSECELIWTSFKKATKKYTYIQQGFINEDKSENKFRIHPVQKPLNLIESILLDYSKEGDLVIDTHSGSATIAVACYNLKRNFIAIERDKEYYDKSCKRLESVINQLSIVF